MAHPGDDRRTRSQTAQNFITPRGDFEGESGDVPISIPSESTQMMVEFFWAEERRAQRDEERAEQEAQQREEERRFAAEREAQQREEERRFAAEREAQQREEERRFAAEQQQRWIDALQNARPPPPVAARRDALFKNSTRKRTTWRLTSIHLKLSLLQVSGPRPSGLSIYEAHTLEPVFWPSLPSMRSSRLTSR